MVRRVTAPGDQYTKLVTAPDVLNSGAFRGEDTAEVFPVRSVNTAPHHFPVSAFKIIIYVCARERERESVRASAKNNLNGQEFSLYKYLKYYYKVNGKPSVQRHTPELPDFLSERTTTKKKKTPRKKETATSDLQD